MYSKIKLFGHPIHPMLVAFPVALYTAAMVCFIVYNSNAEVFWFKVAYVANLAGICMAVLAALPGFIDFLNIPSRKKAKNVGITHMLMNVTALVLFAINFFMLRGEWNDPTPNLRYALPLTIVGFLCTLVAGYLGWTLVQTYHVGVNPLPASEADVLAEPHLNKDTPRTAGPFFTPARNKDEEDKNARNS